MAGVACSEMNSSSRFCAFILLGLAGAALPGCTAGVAATGTASQVSTTAPPTLDTVFLASDAWSTKPGGAFELFSAGGSSTPTRLTYCSGCQALSVSPSLDRTRVALRRVTADTNKDGRLDEFDVTTLLLVDLARQIEGPFLPAGWSTSSVDWASDGTFLVHTSSPDGKTDGLYTMDANGQNNQQVIFDAGVRVRGARINPTRTSAAYERIASTGPGKSEIWIGSSNLNQTKITDSGISGDLLPNTLYVVGSDAGPDYSPDGLNLVFRRLTSTAVAGGAWDILVVPVAGGQPRVIASGPQYRSDPDWSKDGILFTESNAATGGTDVIVINPDTGARKILQSFPSGYRAIAPRWIAGVAG
jgi:Tol biopolymer transport system component